MAKFTITVTATLNGKSCKNPQIEFIQGEGYIYPCEIKDGVITIEILPGAPANACIEGYIKCDDTCLNCPPQYFKKCLCNDVTVLTVCQKCVDGFIVEICTPEQLAQGMICTPDGCKCPPDKPVKDPNTGQCVQCITGTTQGCKVCIGGSWVIIDCGPNEVCKDGKCECAPGYVRDPFTGECVPPPQCSDDEDCGICETCVNGVCVPVVCPPNHRCIDGICVYWPCTSVTCNNGADCGEDCGCLNGECVPCHLLNCRLDASCQSALGCRCNALGLCEPVPDCGQYCDGETPCLDTNCTCYNNRCVDCSRFPCPEDCATHYNCGCNAEGECDGGKACTDTLTLKKEEVCSNDGCQLVADYTTENKCMCDPIEFRISNTRDCTGEVAGTALVLKTEIFKNNLPYKDYKSIVGMGDDEEVSGTITTHIDFFTKNSNGLWVPETVTNAPVANVAIVDNKIDLINITAPNLGFLAPNSVITANRKVVITLRATGVEIPNNDCKKYNSAVIATYEIDLTAPTIYCPVINSFKTIKSTFLKDTVSTRRPLFVWSKSTTGTFANTKFVTNGVYAQSGWFRKEYGNLIAGKWQDKINNPKRGAENQFNELWNNYNYKVKVDCGCKSNDATLQKVVFCCPKEFDYETTACGRIITIPPFDTCLVNKRLSTLNSPDYIIPIESQTFYYVTLNGVDYLMNPAGGPITQNFVKELDVPITSIVFSQRYNGTPLIARACDVEYIEEVVAPDFKLEAECGKITVTQIAGTNAILSVKILGTTQNFTKVTGQNKWELVVPTNSATFDVAATFQNSCVFVKTIDVFCQPEVDAVPTSLIAKGDCPNGGTNPNIALDAIKGFLGVVEFLDPRPGKTWVDGTLSGTTYKITFTNFAAGTYTFTARQKSDPTINATVTITIEPPIELELTAEPACNQGNGKLILNAAPGSVWNIIGSGFPGTGSQQTIPAGGILNITIPNVNAGGSFAVSFVSDLSGKSCGGSQTIVVPKNGGTVMVSVTAPDTACRGTEIPFTVNDGGAGLQYTLLYQDTVFKNSNGAVITTINGGQSGTATYSGTANQMTLNPYLTVADCFTAIVSSKTVNIKVTPNIVDTTSCYTGQQGFYQVSFTSSLYPLTNPVLTVGNSSYPFTHQGNGLYIYAGALSPQNNQNYTITTAYDGCQIIKQFAFIECNDPNNCPPVGTPNIIAVPQYPCTVSTTVLSYTSGMIFDVGDTYTWVDVISGTTLSSGLIVGGIVPPQSVTAELSPRTYKLVIGKNNGACNYESASIEVQAQAAITATISGPGIYPNTQTLSSGTQYSYTTISIAGATYSWVLTNPGGGSTTNLGTTSTVTGVSFLPGLSNITVTITSNGCTYTDSQDIQVDVNCSGSAMIGLVGVGNDTCREIGATVSGVAPGDIVNSWTWLINNTPSPQTGVALPVLNFDTSVIAAGEAKDIKLLVTTEDGCSFVSNTLPYTRCSCMCFSNTCISVNNYRIGVHTVGEFQAGSVFDWGVYFFGKRSTNHIVKLDGVTIFATGFLTAAESACTFTNVCDVGTQYLGDDPATLNLALTGASGAAWSQNGDTSPNTYVGGGCLALTNDGVIIPNTALWGTGVNAITLPTAGLVTVEVINGVCDSALSASNRNEFYLACV